MEIIAYEMMYDKEMPKVGDVLPCISFEMKYFPEYMKIYNECFFEMRKTLDIQPYNFLSDYSQIAEKASDIYLLVENDEIIGSVACCGNEIDDLIVNIKFQRRGYGKRLLLWAMQHIRECNNDPIRLHVAEWNRNALALYNEVGFEIAKRERVR